MPCAANVVISNAATQNMTCSAGTCAPTAADAVLNVQDLEAMLASGNATVTTAGAGVQATNINIKTRLTWSAGTTLALDAFRSIEVTSKVTVAGTGGVSLTANDGGGGGEFVCGDSGAITFASLSNALTINETTYMLVNSVASLASAIAANPAGAFAFAKNYNAKKDGTYTSSPITTTFTGLFNGLGNTISNLSINDPSENAYVGLFSQTASGSAITNIHLEGEKVQGNESGSRVGGLVGTAGGATAYSFTNGTVSGASWVGGLLGYGWGDVKGSGSAATVVSGGAAGGLISVANSGSISDSWATGNVTGTLFVGGLVGYDRSTGIRQSWASGQVLGTGNGAATGGLVGAYVAGSIDRTHASGAVSCSFVCGGLVGWVGNDTDVPRISQSYATGTVTAVPASALIHMYPLAGGLVGWKELGEISNSYASGTTSGYLAGGLVGDNERNEPYPTRTVSSSYATGAVTGTKWAGGLIGCGDGKVTHGYWDSTTSEITNLNLGDGCVPGVTGIKGLNNKKLKSGLPKGFDPKFWDEDSKINGGLPYLINNPPAN